MTPPTARPTAWLRCHSCSRWTHGTVKDTNGRRRNGEFACKWDSTNGDAGMNSSGVEWGVDLRLIQRCQACYCLHHHLCVSPLETTEQMLLFLGAEQNPICSFFGNWSDLHPHRGTKTSCVTFFYTLSLYKTFWNSVTAREVFRCSMR